jgi:DNA adenine methylase
MNPVVKWAGGKRWLVEQLKPLFQQKTNYRLVEPFCGGLAVSLGLFPSKALLNDLNGHLINLYKHIQNGFKISLNMKNEESFYYKRRDEFNSLKSVSPLEHQRSAELFYYLNRTCFNGLCRFNSSGKFNVPFGRYKTINYITDFSDYVPIFKNWKFSSKDFAKLKIGINDIIYLDPPYDTDFTQYTANGFKWEDQIRLINWTKTFDNPVIISNQATARIIELYRDSGFVVSFVDAPRRISANGSRDSAKEVLATKGI